MSRGAITLDVQGVADVNAALAAAAARSPRLAEAALTRGLDNIVRDTKGYTPVDEGDQRSTVRKEQDGLSGQVLVGGIPGEATGKMVDYAAANELGVVNGPRAGKHPIQPSLTPAFEENRAGIIRDLEAVPTEAFR